VFDQIFAESFEVFKRVRLAMPYLVTLADDNKELPFEEAHLRSLPFVYSVKFA
jgi:hypothetical protein